MVALARSDDIQELKASHKFDRDEAKFGDGYRRVAEKGIRNSEKIRRISWVPFNETEANEVIDMLEATGGVTPVEWTPPNETGTQTWTVEKYDFSYDSPTTIVVTCTLERFYG